MSEGISSESVLTCYTPPYFKTTMPLFSHQLILPAAILLKFSCKTDQSYSSDLILRITSEFERLQNVDADARNPYTDSRTLHKFIKNFQFLLGNIYYGFLLNYFSTNKNMPSIDEKGPVLFLLVESIKYGFLLILYYYLF